MMFLEKFLFSDWLAHGVHEILGDSRAWVGAFDFPTSASFSISIVFVETHKLKRFCRESSVGKLPQQKKKKANCFPFAKFEGRWCKLSWF